MVFELNDVYDFGVDRYAYFGVESESLLIEGPFNKLTIHQDAFANSQIDELVIGCYCLDCESFIGDCVAKFGARSIRNTASLDLINAGNSSFKRIKLFGVKLGDSFESNLWNLDDLPNIQSLEYLEISNLASFSNSYGSEENYLNEFQLKKSTELTNLKDLYLKNNQIRRLNGKSNSSHLNSKFSFEFFNSN